MSNENETKSALTKLLDWLSGTMGKITAVFIAASAMVPAAYKLIETLSPQSPPSVVAIASTAPRRTMACHRVDLRPLKAVVPLRAVKLGTVSWFNLMVKNDCEEDLRIRVEFESQSVGIGIARSDSWPSYLIRAGESKEREVNPPNLSLLSEQPQKVQIKVLVFDKDGQPLFEDTPQIELVG